MGNPEGVQRQKKGKKVNQKISRWNFGIHLNHLEYKLLEEGIKPEKISEAYSKQTCPKCGRRHKCTDRNYKCRYGYCEHRDIHGARNILSLGLNKRICIKTKINESIYGRRKLKVVAQARATIFFVLLILLDKQKSEAPKWGADIIQKLNILSI